MTVGVAVTRSSSRPDDTDPWIGHPHLDDDLDRVQAALLAAVGVGERHLPRACSAMLDRRGHMFRPLLCLVAAYSHDGARRPAPAGVVDAAAAVQALHVASLVHDDIIDDARTRRGVPTVAAEHGSTAALLSGDYLLAVAVEVAAAVGQRATEEISRSLRRMCQGQMAESAGLFDPARTESRYRDAAAGKTACLIGTSMVLGAQAVGAGDEAIDLLRRCGEHLGLAFQMWDDVLDFRPERGYDSRFQDVRNGVYTMPVILAMDAGPSTCRRLLAACRTDPSALSDLHALLDDTGTLDLAARKARAEADAAFAVAEKLHQSGMLPGAPDLVSFIVPRLLPGLDDATAEPASRSERSSR